MNHAPRVLISRAALRHNYHRTRALAGDAKLMAILKADAYGHGLVRIARWLPEAEAFGVACPDEAEQLRRAGIRQTIVLLAGPQSMDDLQRIDALRLDMVLHNDTQLEMLSEWQTKSPVPSGIQAIWLKIDTGMHRLGFPPDEIAGALERCTGCMPDIPIRLMSHLAAAYEARHPMNQAQCQCFEAASRGVAAPRSLANSAALLSLPETRYEWVRPGLMLYGVSPQTPKEGRDWGLQPVMQLESQLIAVHRLQAGEPVGYGASWRCPETMPIGILAAGYADGYPRHIKSGTPVLINDKTCTIIGSPSMDMLSVDLRQCPQAKTGDPAVLWGTSLPIERIAQQAATLPYDLLCRIHKRAQFLEA